MRQKNRRRTHGWDDPPYGGTGVPRPRAARASESIDYERFLAGPEAARKMSSIAATESAYVAVSEHVRSSGGQCSRRRPGRAPPVSRGQRQQPAPEKRHKLVGERSLSTRRRRLRRAGCRSGPAAPAQCAGENGERKRSNSTEQVSRNAGDRGRTAPTTHQDGAELGK